MKKTTVAITLFLLAAAAGTVLASTQARLSATVMDTSGNPIPDAVVTVTCPELPTFEKIEKPNKKGSFKMLILDATRSYVFTVEAPGYRTHIEEFKISIGTMDNHFDLVLKSHEEIDAEQHQELLERPGFKELEQGNKLADSGKLDEARLKYQEALDAVPDLLLAREQLTRTLYDLGEHQAALDSAKTCLEADPENLGCLAIAVEASQHLGDTAGHDAYLALYQELNPDDPATVFNQAVQYINAMDDEQARPLLEECLDIDPEFPKCLFEYGMLLLRSGDLEGAKQHLETYLEVAPEGPDAQVAAETIKYL